MSAKGVFDTEAIPGIMTLTFVASIGNSRSGEANGINIASKAIYSYIRNTNSGARNYDPVDLQLYLLAMDSLYIYYATLCKIYSLMLKLDNQN